MKSASPPPAPDPGVTSGNQARYNQQAAQAQMGMNMVNQVTPYGNLTYSQSGVNNDGTPRFEARVDLTPEQRSLMQQQQQLAGGFNSTAQQQLGRVNSVLGQPISLNNEATESRLFELGRRRLDPALNQAWQQRESDLLNRGVTMGSEAYRDQQRQFMEGRNDAYNQLALTGRGQAVSELLTERNQPIQELGAIMGYGSPTMPNFVNTPQVSVASPDYQGAVNTQYQSQLQAAQRAAANRNAMMGGLFGLGGTVLGAAVGGPMGASIGGQLGKGFGGWMTGG